MTPFFRSRHYTMSTCGDCTDESVLNSQRVKVEPQATTKETKKLLCVAEKKF